MSNDRDNEQINGDDPATRGDLAIWGGRLQEQIDELKEGQARLERGQAAILEVVKSIDAQLKEMSDHTERIERLEKTVFQAER